MTSTIIDPGWDPAECASRTSPGALAPNEDWYDTLISVPQHVFTPRWWECDDGEWSLRDGPSLAAEHSGSWSAAIDPDHVVVTRIGRLHADDAAPGDHPAGPPAEKTALPGAVTCLFDYADVHPGCRVLLADAASGYECALLACRLGSASVTALASARTADRVQPRLAELGLSPSLASSTPGPCDRMISAVPAPLSPECLAALPPGGRLAAVLPIGALAAEKFPDGTARGYVLVENDDASDLPKPFCDDGVSSAPVTVQPDGTITLRLDFPER